jgi:spore maturation protein CgeB
MLRENLAALAKRDAELARRLCWPAGDDHVRSAPDGALVYRIGQSSIPLELSPEAARCSLAAAGLAREAFVFGLGLGEMVDALLAEDGRRSVLAWERDPWMMRLALQRHDWRAELASGRLRLLLGTDLLEEAPRTALSPILAHPLLGQVYAIERTLLAPTAARPVAMVCAGGLFVRDLADALSNCGFSPYTLDIQRLSREELSRSVSRVRPALLASINYTEGLAEFCAEQRLKLVCWEIDPSTSALPRCVGATDHAFVFTHRRCAVQEYRAAGFQKVRHLPLAANPGRRRPVELEGAEDERYRARVSIVAASMVQEVPRHERSFLDAWRRYREATRDDLARTGSAEPRCGGPPGDRDEVARRPHGEIEIEGARVLAEVLEEQARDDSRYRVPEILERRWPEFAHTAGPAAARAVGEITAALKRLSCARRLARFGVRVWGDAGWRQVEGDGVSYQGPAGHERELGKVYCGSSINVDLGRIYQQDIVTMRVFDVMACGGFVLAEHSDDLASLFEEGLEVDSWATPGELVAKVAYYLEHPRAARELARRGREAVLERHTIQARVEHMLRVAGCRVSASPPPRLD